MRNSIVLPQRVSPFYHERIHILHTFLRLLRIDWSGLQRETSWAFDSHSFMLSFDHHEMSLNIDMKIILPVKFSGVSFNLNSNSWTSWLSCNVLNPGKIFHPLEFHPLRINSVQVSVLRCSFEPLQSLFPCSVWLGVLVYLTKTQYRIWKDVDLCALKTDDLFITNQRQILPWRVFPINCFHYIDLILFRHQFCGYVEHLFHCEIFFTLDGMPIVCVILSHEYRWLQCWRHEHSPYHRMFFAVFFCNIHRR